MQSLKVTLSLFLCLMLSSSVIAQDNADSLQVKSRSSSEELVKTGWNFGGLPVVAFDTDLGFQYGALLNIFNYGDGSRYPDFDHNLYLEVSRFTKGSGINRLFFDSKVLIPGIRFTTDLSLLTDKMYDFFGFNGYESAYNTAWADDQHDDYLSRAFYKYDRKVFRNTVDLQGRLPMENFGWAAGYALYNYQTGSVDIEALNEGKETDDPDRLPDVETLYDQYVDWGIISEQEKEGGFATYLKAGIVYDTRDNEPNPMRGMWTELVASYAPSFLGIGEEFSHLKLTLTHRQYFTLVRDRLSLAYRLTYQGTYFGECPFYLQPNITTLILRGSTSEGLGGARSLRGVVRNRVIGNDVAYANTELRWKFVRFQALNQNFYLSLNGFADAGQVVRPIEFDEPESNEFDDLDYSRQQIFSPDDETIHLSVGGGLRIVMNQNFIIAIDHGRAIDSRDGESGTYIGLNFLF